LLIVELDILDLSFDFAKIWCKLMKYIHGHNAPADTEEWLRLRKSLKNLRYKKGQVRGRRGYTWSAFFVFRLILALLHQSLHQRGLEQSSFLLRLFYQAIF
jgi:hypothetical protein